MKSKGLKGNIIFVIALASCFSFGILAADKPHWGKAKHHCEAKGTGIVSAKLKGVKIGRKKKTCESRKGYKAPGIKAFGAKGKPNYCKTKPTGVYGYWKIKNDTRCTKSKKIIKKKIPSWTKRKHRCVGPGKGNITARLTGGQKGMKTKAQKLKLCQSKNAPTLNVGGIQRQPDSCKKKLLHVVGTWFVQNDQTCLPKRLRKNRTK